MRRFFELTADEKADMEPHFGGKISNKKETEGGLTVVLEVVKKLGDKDFEVTY